MNEERRMRICALLCLLSSLARREGDPSPLSRRIVRRMLRSGALDGLAVKPYKGCANDLPQRANRLLERAAAMQAHVESYLAQGYHILLDGDALWPQHLAKLGEDAPLMLFARGNPALLSGRMAAVAGSRSISARTREKAEAIGRLLAGRGMTVVTGGARGVDSAAAKGALEAGGGVVVIPAVSAEEFFRSDHNRRACDAGRLMLLCETPPDEPFSSVKALTRNHTIYALGDVAMVVASRQGMGGTWSGARACLRGAWSPLYILDEAGGEFAGNAALIALGAMRMQIIREGEKDELILQGPDRGTLRQLQHPTKADEEAPAVLRLSVTLDAIPREQTLRFLGWKGQELDERVKAQLKQAERMALASIAPIAVFAVAALADGRRLSGTAFSAQGEAVGFLLDGCQGAALMAATLGGESERLLLRTQAVDPALATVLDAVLSAAIEAAADRVSEAISVRAKAQGWETTARFSPGYGDMPMSQTQEICGVLDSARQIGLTVSASGLMMPRKSVCAIIGEGKSVRGNRRTGCAFCAMRETCGEKKTGTCACAQRRKG